eukprot:TRINITY_DN78704_c0_g1_i1.p1 TRINITY_DN78704_c0_g1~~TRINITY_DN78704_c0_g1_i1.p1  ORF type:complete len:206 (+),score=45.39 TRINITY_DN78704_c0_g1_i1:40-657(+)
MRHQVWPQPKRPSGPCVKAGNLTPGITDALLKQALAKWGVEGIKEVNITESRFGVIAFVVFKSEEQAQMMMMAQGVEVEGRPLMLEYMRAAPPPPVRQPDKRNAQPQKESAVEKLVKVTKLPAEFTQEELITHLRSHGVLGIAQVILKENQEALLRFNEPKNVKAAVSKADNTTFKSTKLTLTQIECTPQRFPLVAMQLYRYTQC